MPEVLSSPAERARKNEAVILQALAATGQRVVANALGCDESTVSRMKSGDIAQMSALIAYCGLKVVSAGARCFDPQYVEALQTLAAVGIQRKGPRLEWGEEE